MNEATAAKERSVSSTSEVKHVNKIQAGFDDPVIGAQSVFRKLLESMSEPGIQSTIESIIASPQVLHPASYAIGLCLFDQDTPVFLSQSLQSSENLEALRFQVSLNTTTTLADADFIVCDEDETPELHQLKLGSEEYPDQSCTLIIQSKSFTEGERFNATGPGIETNRIIQCSALNQDLFKARKKLSTQFPLGIDIIFTHKNQFFCLSRTTQLASETH